MWYCWQRDCQWQGHQLCMTLERSGYWLTLLKWSSDWHYCWTWTPTDTMDLSRTFLEQRHSEQRHACRVSLTYIICLYQCWAYKHVNGIFTVVANSHCDLFDIVVTSKGNDGYSSFVNIAVFRQIKASRVVICIGERAAIFAIECWVGLQCSPWVERMPA